MRRARAEKALVRGISTGTLYEIVSAPRLNEWRNAEVEVVPVWRPDWLSAIGFDAMLQEVARLRPLTDHARALLALPVE